MRIMQLDNLFRWSAACLLAWKGTFFDCVSLARNGLRRVTASGDPRSQDRLPMQQHQVPDDRTGHPRRRSYADAGGFADDGDGRTLRRKLHAGRSTDVAPSRPETSHPTAAQTP